MGRHAAEPGRWQEPAWGEPPWHVGVRLPARPLPDRVDVAIAGAGFTGLAAAVALARAGARVAVLERGPLGAGASGRSGGIALEGTAAGPLPHASACLASLAGLVAREQIECHLVLDGCLEVAHRSTPPRGDLSWPDAGTRLVVEREVPGGSVDPGALVAGLARAALAAGATLHEHVALERWTPGPPVRIEAGGRTLEADRLFLALNGFLPTVAPGTAVRPALTLALATAPLSRATREAIGLGLVPFYTVDLPYLWGRTTADGRLVIGAGLAFDEADDVRRVSIARADVRAQLATLERRVRGLHPSLRDVAIERSWGGPIAFRRDGRPLLAGLGAGVLASGACAGHGVALSAAIAERVVAWALRGEDPPEWGALGDGDGPG